MWLAIPSVNQTWNNCERYSGRQTENEGYEFCLCIQAETLDCRIHPIAGLQSEETRFENNLPTQRSPLERLLLGWSNGQTRVLTYSTLIIALQTVSKTLSRLQDGLPVQIFHSLQKQTQLMASSTKSHSLPKLPFDAYLIRLSSAKLGERHPTWESSLDCAFLPFQHSTHLIGLVPSDTRTNKTFPIYPNCCAPVSAAGHSWTCLLSLSRRQVTRSNWPYRPRGAQHARCRPCRPRLLYGRPRSLIGQVVFTIATIAYSCHYCLFNNSVTPLKTNLTYLSQCFTSLW